MTDKAGPLLTDSQLKEWSEKVHQAYLDVIRANSIAAKKDRRLSRYIRRHYGVNYIKGENDGMGRNGQEGVRRLNVEVGDSQGTDE